MSFDNIFAIYSLELPTELLLLLLFALGSPLNTG